MNRFLKFIGKYYVYGFIVVVIALAFKSKVQDFRKTNNLKKRGILVKGTLEGKVGGFRSWSTYSYKYTFSGKKYIGEFQSACLNTTKIENLNNHYFDVIVDKNDPKDSNMLIFKKDYEKYNIVKKHYKYEILNDCGSGLW